MIRLLALVLAAALWSSAVTVRIGKSQRDLSLEQYVAGVLAGESSVFQSPEASKAMAIAARTYAVRLPGRHRSEGFDFCATTHCQRLDLAAVTPRLEAIAEQTAGELLWFEGRPAFTVYSRDCGGRTEDGGALWPDVRAPYLKSHTDPFCSATPWQWRADPLQVADALRRAALRVPRALERITISQRTASGRARILLLSGGGETVPVSAGSFRFAVGREIGWNFVASDAYEVHGLVFEGRGSGHGVGLCQHGADRMGAAGRSYRDILAFYYPGTAVGLTAQGLAWQRIGGDSVALLTTRPDQDRGVLALAERIAGQSRLQAPSNVEIRIYPDIETFRNATGEPGWVAAQTVGTRIHMQPAAVLRGRGVLESTLRHELLHVIIESHAGPGLPVWFREGLAGYLEHPVAGGALRIPPDADLRQTKDPARARRAYRDATRSVAALVERYGEPAVLAWIRTGIPREVQQQR